MTDKHSSTVVVSRELAEVLMNTTASSMARAEIFAILAAPVEQQGEPVAYAESEELEQLAENLIDHVWIWRAPKEGDVPLYRHAQPPAKVVLPERVDPEYFDSVRATGIGWNACIDEVAKLNGVKP